MTLKDLESKRQKLQEQKEKLEKELKSIEEDINRENTTFKLGDAEDSLETFCDNIKFLWIGRKCYTTSLKLEEVKLKDLSGNVCRNNRNHLVEFRITGMLDTTPLKVSGV